MLLLILNDKNILGSHPNVRNNCETSGYNCQHPLRILLKEYVQELLNKIRIRLKSFNRAIIVVLVLLMTGQNAVEAPVICMEPGGSIQLESTCISGLCGSMIRYSSYLTGAWQCDDCLDIPIWRFNPDPGYHRRDVVNEANPFDQFIFTLPRSFTVILKRTFPEVTIPVTCQKPNLLRSTILLI